MQRRRTNTLWYGKTGRLRAGWRMVIYIFMGIIVFLPFIPILKILPLSGGDSGPTSAVDLVFVAFLNMSFVIAAWITLKWVDRRPAALLGLNFWPESLREFVIGVGIGLANFAGVFLVLVACGWITVEWTGIASGGATAFLLYFASYLVFAGFEELINRGYLFQALCEGIGVWAAAISISLIFSLVHLPNPAFSILGGIFLFIHGLLYTVVYLKTRSLWTPIGLHMAWNFAQGPISGMKVSGTSVGSSLLATQPTGADVWTGGDFGVEGGLIAILISAVILVVVLKGRWLKPSARFLRIEKTWKERTEASPNLSTSDGLIPQLPPSE